MMCVQASPVGRRLTGATRFPGKKNSLWMFGMLITGVVGYYIGLYTFLWSQLYSPQRRIKDKIVPDDLFKYKQL